MTVAIVLAALALVVAVLALLVALGAHSRLRMLRREVHRRGLARAAAPRGEVRETHEPRAVAAAPDHSAAIETLRAGLEATRTDVTEIRSEVTGVRKDVDGVRADVATARADVAAARTDIGRGLRNVAVVRYDAFGDIGGRMSFSVALVDDDGDGVVLSSIHARTESRTYAKGIVGGASEVVLTPEEQEALAAARSGTTVR